MSTTSVDVAAPPRGEPVPFPSRLLPWVLAMGGVVGLAAALVLTIEKIALIRDPGYVPSCSINPILSCGSIMSTPQSQVLGFPNPLLGIAGFAVVTTIGMAFAAARSVALAKAGSSTAIAPASPEWDPPTRPATLRGPPRGCVNGRRLSRRTARPAPAPGRENAASTATWAA